MAAPKPELMRLLRYIRGYQLAKGYSPSFSEMAVGIGRSPKSKQPIANMLAELESRGLLARLYNRTRAIDVLAEPSVPCAPDGAPLFEVAGFREGRV